MKEYDYILLDFDGTIMDTGPGIKNAVRYALKHYGIKENDEQRLTEFIGPPLVDMFQKLYGFSYEQAHAAVYIFREYYTSKGWKESSLYPGIPEVLNKLKASGKTLIMATGKPEDLAIELSRENDILDLFDFICGTLIIDGKETRFRKTEIINDVLISFPIEDKSKAIMIGDRYSDINSAHECGIDAMGVLYGFGNLEEHKKAGADYIAGTVNDIITCLL